MEVDNILSIITGKDEANLQHDAPVKFESGSANVGSGSSTQAKQREKGKKKQKAAVKKKVEKVPKRYQTLFALVQGMVGCAIAVELKDDSIAEGLLYEVLYPSCDMALTNVKYKRYLQPIPNNVETLYIKGRRIRYIIFPDHLNVHKILKKSEQRRLRAKNFYGRTSRK